MSPRIEPWPFEHPVLLYALGTGISKRANGSRMINAYFVDPYSTLPHKKNLMPLSLPLGLLLILIPGYLYQDGYPTDPVQEWRNRPVQTETLDLQDLQEADTPYQMPFLSNSPCQENQDLFRAIYFHFIDNSSSPKSYLIASSEIIRTFIAPRSNLLNFLYSEEFISDYISYQAASDGGKNKLLLSDDTPRSLKGDSTLRWLYWLLASKATYSEWKSIKSAYQSSQIFQAKIPFPLSGHICCHILPFRDDRMIWSIKELYLEPPDQEVEVSLPAAKPTVSSNPASASRMLLPDPSRICGDGASAHQGSETELFAQPFVFGNNLKIQKTHRKPGTPSHANPHAQPPVSDPTPLSVQEGQPHGTNPLGGFTVISSNNNCLQNDSYTPTLLPTDIKPGFESFAKVLNQLFRSMTVSHIHMRYYSFPVQHPLSQITLPGGMTSSRREFAVCSFNHLGAFFAVLEIDASDGKSISTLLFRCCSEKIEATAQRYIQQLGASGGQWNRDSILDSHTILVRHCKYQDRALYKHILEFVT